MEQRQSALDLLYQKKKKIGKDRTHTHTVTSFLGECSELNKDIFTKSTTNPSHYNSYFERERTVGSERAMYNIGL